MGNNINKTKGQAETGLCRHAYEMGQTSLSVMENICQQNWETAWVHCLGPEKIDAQKSVKPFQDSCKRQDQVIKTKISLQAWEGRVIVVEKFQRQNQGAGLAIQFESKGGIKQLLFQTRAKQVLPQVPLPPGEKRGFTVRQSVFYFRDGNRRRAKAPLHSKVEKIEELQ